MAEPELKPPPTREKQPAKNTEVKGSNEHVVEAEVEAKAEARKRSSSARQVRFLVGYYLLLLGLSLWGILDVWSSNLTLARWVGIQDSMRSAPILRTIGFTMIGGLLGSVLYQNRMLFKYYIKDKDGYDPRWFGKYLTAPWEAAAMALVVLALIRGGVAAFGGSTGTAIQPVNNFAAFSTGALVGFGMRDVLGWLGKLVTAMFPSGSSEQDAPPSGQQDPPASS